MTISPRAQAMLEGPPGTAEEIFEQGFHEMALQQIMKELPEIADQVAGFKILEANPDVGTAVGSFIILRGEDEIHIPAVISDGALEPFDMMYVKSQGVFLPLNPDWLQELDRLDASRMGEAVKTPEGLRSDQDIRNVIVPPTTGRYSYASAQGRKLLPAYLSGSHPLVKKSFLRTLEGRPKLAQYVFKTYGVSTIKDAVRVQREKEAKATAHVHFVTIETPVSETREIFGKDTPSAAKQIAEKGYAAKDDRENVSQLVTTEHPRGLEVPTTAGFYRVFFADGSCPVALVFPKILCLKNLGYRKTLTGSRADGHASPGVVWIGERDAKTRRLLVTADGRVVCTSKDFVAESVQRSDVPESLLGLLKTPQARTPRNGQRGFFCDVDGASLTVLEPIKVEHVTHKEGTRHIQAASFTGAQVNISQIKDSPLKAPRAFSGKDHTYSDVSYRFLTEAEREDDFGYHTRETIVVPWDYKFIPINDLVDEDLLLGNPEMVNELFQGVLADSGAKTLQIKNASMGQVEIENKLYDHFGAVKKIAVDYNVGVPAAEYAVKTASETYNVTRFLVADAASLQKFHRRTKIAQGTMPPGGEMMPPEGGMTPPGPPMPPGGEMMPPGPPMPPGGEMMPPGPPMPPGGEMMPPGPPMPPPPNPLQIAAQEIADQVMMNNQMVQNELISQQQSLQNQLAVLQAVAARAEQISAEMQGYDAGPPVQAPPPVEVAPPDGGMPPEPPMPPGPGAGMPVESPQAMEQAAMMDDPEVFDAAAIAALAQQNAFDQSVSQFTPIFQETLDKIGQLLLDVRIKSSDLRNRLGEDGYSDLNEKLKTLFQTFGELVVDLDAVVAGTADE